MSGALIVAGGLGHDRAHQERVVELGAQVQPVRVEAPRDLAGQGGGGHADAARLFQRQGAGDAVAEIGGKGCHAPAAVTGVFRVGGEVAHRRCREEVEERLGKPEGEAGELDEAAVGVEAFRVRRVTGVADEEVGAQHPVVGLLAGIDRDHRAGAYGEVGPARADAVEVEPERGAAVVVDVRPEERRLGRVLPVAVVELRPHISAELEADIGSGDVVEAVPVQIADLHVLHRCLHRHVGGLRPSNRDEARCGTEEKTFHHLHLNLHCYPGRDRSPSGAAHPGRVP